MNQSSDEALPIITAFDRSPDGGQGQARDTRVRWALEEVGQTYDVLPVTFTDLKETAHRARNPFGQIPTYEKGNLTLFESGSIVLHIAESYPGLFPDNAQARARAISWMFASVSTIEPRILEREVAILLEADKPWHEERLLLINDRVRTRLGDLSNHLASNDWLDGEFTAGDLMMVGVLRRLNRSGLLNEYSNLAAYVARGESRPAFKRAFEDQLAFNTR